jgi:hypothetical protein
MAKSRRAIREALETQATQAATGIRKGDPNWEHAVSEDPLKKAYASFTRDVVMSFAHGTLRSIEQKKQLTDDVLLLWEDQVNIWLGTHAAQRIKDMTASTKKMISALIQQAVAEGMSIPNTVNHMRSSFSSLSIMRAARIARTEIIAASNFGSLEGAKATEIPLEKEWLAWIDDRTRDSHRDDLNGERVPLDGTFSNGLGYPGDPAGDDPGEVINCRCTLVYVEVPE